MESPNNINYVFECMKCGCTAFKLLPGGYTGCMQCNKKYSYVNALSEWIPYTMSPTEYLIKVKKKKWDPLGKKFIDYNTPLESKKKPRAKRKKRKDDDEDEFQL